MSPDLGAAPLAPASEAEVGAILARAAARREPVEVRGGGTRPVGRPVQGAVTLSTLGLSGITLLEPAEMVAGARAGTPLAAFEAALAERGQRLPFEPMDHRPLLGTAGEPTVGGVAALNVSGPRRVQAGAARDAMIGLRLVNGRGEAVASGGRVMKNVTGLDLVKLLAGSAGALGVVTEVTFRTLPVPERAATLAIEGLSDAAGVAALSAGLGSPYDVTGAAHLPAGTAGERALTLLRVEGLRPSVAYRARELAALLAPHGPAAPLDDEAGAALWRATRDAAFLAEPRAASVWRASVAPSRGPALAATVMRAHPARAFYDWGGGLVWLAVEGGGEGPLVQRLAAQAGGHAALVRGPPAERAAFGAAPVAEAVARLTRGLKAAFDPAGVLNPGRLGAGT